MFKIVIKVAQDCVSWRRHCLHFHGVHASPQAARSIGQQYFHEKTDKPSSYHNFCNYQNYCYFYSRDYRYSQL